MASKKSSSRNRVSVRLSSVAATMDKALLTSVINLARLATGKACKRGECMLANRRLAAVAGSSNASVANWLAMASSLSSSLSRGGRAAPARSGSLLLPSVAAPLAALFAAPLAVFSLNISSNCAATNCRCCANAASNASGVSKFIMRATKATSSGFAGRLWVCASSRYCSRCSRLRRKV